MPLLSLTRARAFRGNFEREVCDFANRVTESATPKKAKRLNFLNYLNGSKKIRSEATKPKIIKTIKGVKKVKNCL